MKHVMTLNEKPLKESMKKGGVQDFLHSRKSELRKREQISFGHASRGFDED